MGDIMKEKKNIPEIRFEGFEGEWEEKRIGELGDIVTGSTPSTQEPLYYSNHGIPWVTPTDITENITYHTAKYLSEKGKQVSRLVPKNSILVTCIASIGKNTMLGTLGSFNQQINGLIPDENKYNTYFLYTESTLWSNEMKRSAASGTMQIVNKKEFSELKTFIPTIEEQSQIGSYFQNLDQQITLEQQKHDKLVTLKKAMLEKMFPKEGASVPEIRFEGFEGEWEEKKLVDIGYTYTGLSGKNKTDFGHGKGRYVTYMNVFSNTIAKKENTEAIEVDHSQNNVQFGDVFFTTSSETPEEVGMSSVWLADCQDTYLNSFCFGYRPVIKVDNYYFAYLLRSTVIRKKIIFLAQGISRYNISKNKVMEISVPLPTIEEQSQIGSYFQNLDKLISLQQQKINKLKNIKKACLDKMFV